MELPANQDATSIALLHGWPSPGQNRVSRDDCTVRSNSNPYTYVLPGGRRSVFAFVTIDTIPVLGCDV